ncbi:SET domain-containing protein-lysine N-methyltransferase, partial [Paraburkholderia strydomiana]|uniref:SET domain-containing protein n=1 Tax=Paraburkholderia strydomiana TaxID=1245417 RepID=UPI0038BCB7BD
RVIDGSLGGNSARWLNHACVANCEAVESNGRVHIHAVSDIKPGEELFIKYWLSVEGRLSAAVRAQYECRCGHRRCRGTMLAATTYRG